MAPREQERRLRMLKAKAKSDHHTLQHGASDFVKTFYPLIVEESYKKYNEFYEYIDSKSDRLVLDQQ